MSKLTNQTALITGATKGMGLAIAKKLAQLGCNLLLAARNSDALKALKVNLEKSTPNINVQYFVCDFSDRTQLDGLTQWVDQIAPHLDILINNVGIFHAVSILDESDEDFDLQMSINYYTPHLLSRSVARNMRRNSKGHIFNISSIASREPVSSAGTYTVTKYAVMGLTHVLRDELRPYGVKVTEIIPGSTLTSSWEGTAIPADQFVLPEDIAAAIATCLTMSEGANVDEIVIKPRYGNI
ncbi:SDR family oxidoreductase [Parapedobacter tibetensis]|uniref:SDR family oxidoreductase n=1 Tax=Parapedobacter tibetensis TaxID=2972951 RepID=UPI00214D6260|nr:SDR family oxidoreductase [Parapedobacter tibetensis]